MIDNLVRVLVEVIVGLQCIGVKLRAHFHVLPDLAVKVMLPASFNNRSTDLSSFTVQESKHNRLTDWAATASLFRAFPSVHVAGIPSDKGFVGLNRVSHLVDASSVHRMANPLKHEPRATLSDLDVLGKFVAADAVLAVREQPHCSEPLIQADSAVLENRADFNRELLPATEAGPHAPRREKRQLLAFALRAFGASRPLRSRYYFQADIWIGEVPYGL